MLMSLKRKLDAGSRKLNTRARFNDFN